MSNTSKCPVCGDTFEQRGGRGRPRTFCTRECNELEKMTGRWEVMLDKAKGRMDLTSRRRMRGRLLRLSNMLNTKGGN